MSNKLVLPEWIAEDIQRAISNPLETAGVLLASLVETSSESIRLLAREMHWVPEAAYLARTPVAMSISSDGYVPALKRAEEIGAVAIWFHTHPFITSSPVASEFDALVDTEISELFKLRTNSDTYSALIVAPSGSSFSFTGFIDVGHSARASIDNIWIVGDRLRLIRSFYAAQEQISQRFDRSVRAFGGQIQEVLGSLNVGIVGLGGTGSCVAELLARLGVRNFLLVDPDHLSESNLTRVYGSKERDVGRTKIAIAQENLKGISSEIQCEAKESSVLNESTARSLVSCDVIFGCTDDNAGRLILSRFSTYFMTPVFDCGVLLSSTSDEKLSGIDGRVTTLSPGSACLVCRQRIDLRRAAAEMLTPEERTKLENEGYAPALGRTEPAVVTFTSSIASAAVSELLERLVGYGPETRPNEMLIRFHEREISTNIGGPRQGHYCDPDALKIGLGMTNPFLEQVWTQ